MRPLVLLLILGIVGAGPVRAQAPVLIAPAPLPDWEEPSPIYTVGSHLYFSLGRDLWVSNGMPDGTRSVAGATVLDSYSWGVGVLNGVFFFRGFERASGVELWRTDGTASGTWRVRDIDTTGSSYPTGGLTIGNRLYFRASDGETGSELWVTDGTEEGTRRVRDIHAGPLSSAPAAFSTDGRRLFFWAEDATHGRELWVSDGTEAGTTLVRDIQPGSTSGYDALVSFVQGRGVFWAKWDATGPILSITDGTREGTKPLRLSGTGAVITPRTTVIVDSSDSRSALFISVTSPSPALWRTDGTPQGTFPVGPQPLSQLRRASDHIVFDARDMGTGVEVWAYGGAAGGVRRISDICSGPCHGSPQELVAIGNTLYVAAEEPTHGRELWSINLATDEVALVADVKPGSLSSNPQQLTAAGTTLFFTAEDGTGRRMLWAIPDPVATSTGRTVNAPPSAFRIWPSPARSSASIRLTLPVAGRLRIHVADLLGRTVIALTDSDAPAGEMTLPVSVSGLAPGIYIVRVFLPGGDIRTAPLVVAH